MGASGQAQVCSEQAFLDQLRGHPARADHRPPACPGRDRQARAQAGHLLREQAPVSQGTGPVRAVLHVPARGVAAPARQHAVPDRLRQQHRGPVPQAPVSAVLPVLRRRRRVRIRARQPDLGAAPDRRLRRHRRNTRRVPGPVSRAKVWSLLPFLFFIPVRIPAWLVLGSWFVLQWAYSAGYAGFGAGSVAYLAHVFGFVAGVVVGLLRGGRLPAAAVPGPPPLPVGPAGIPCRARLSSRSCRRWLS